MSLSKTSNLQNISDNRFIAIRISLSLLVNINFLFTMRIIFSQIILIANFNCNQYTISRIYFL